MDTFSDMMHREHQQHLSGAADLASTPLPTAAAATAATTATTATAFEYSFPLTDGGDDDTESNKSTPYYTPLEFFQSSFEFPSPRSDNKTHGQAQHAHSPSDSRDDRTKQLPLAPAVAAAAAVASGSHSPLPTLPPAAGTSRDSAPADSHIAEHERAKKAPPPSPATPKLITSVAGKSMQATSPPVVNRKIRRFSLYERRSCSPQHLLIKSVGAAAESSARGDEFVNDKENTKPHFLEKKEDSIHLVSNSGSNSPIAILDETASPKILAASEANMFGNSRLAYSPKLLASINNLHLSGSPLGVISSAGYKNGNYFKFPEIDHVVQELASAADDSSGHLDNQTRSRQRNIAEKCGILSPAPSKARCKSTSVEHSTSKAAGTDARSQRADAASLSHRTAGELRRSQTELAKSAPSANKTTVDSRKNRKNKNNLTIRITDVPSSVAKPLSVSPSPSPSTKPKTPTIKSTKEKALSLDSAAGESELTIIVTSRRDSYASCDEIDVQPLPVGSSHWMQQGTPNASQSQTIKISEPSVTSSRSTSLSQLSDVSAASALLGKPLSGQRLGDALSMSTRRRVACANTDWYQRNQYPYHLGKGLSVENGKSPSVVQESVGGVSNAAKAPEVTLSHDDKLPVPGQGQGKVIPNSSSGTAATLSASQRGAYKHNPILHASNTNLKTLPEFLTLVEFSTTGAKDNESPYKQKSMDLPSSTVTTVRLKNTATGTSSTNLLQRRGSNQSLTLNLHGSCSNLLGNCRSGLSLSNYSLGSVTNSTSNLNSKSSGHLDLGATNASQMISARNPSVPTAQVAKQTLFRRRGSNHSLTLTNLTAASCGNLNTFASQNSLNVDRLQPLQTGVTRTMSFITPTKSTVSSVLQKRGLLERRGSNQSLTLNMGGSFGGVGTERNVLPTQPTNLYLSEEPDAEAKPMTLHPTTNCAQHRKFFSSESLNKANNQFSDLNQTHKRNANQVCFGSVSDLKPSDYADVNKPGGSREHFDFQESTVCTCTGVRNIVTRPLSPQTTSEEFKIYLANIQMLQNASNALNQQDLIKLNYIFDNSYRSNSKSIVEQPLPVLNVHGSREAETPPGLLSTSEDHEVAARFQDVVGAVLQTIQPDDVEQKRMFCDLHKEFWDLPLNHQEKPMVFGSQTKNRYKTILPNENSRVILEKERNILAEFLAHYDFLRLPVDLVEPRIAGTDEVPYINANYIKGPDYTSKCYVATQGPLPNTIFEFWLMVYLNTHRHFQNAKKLSSPITKNGEMLQQYDQKIVMLTNFLENNRQKCSAYFPVELHEIFVTSARHEVAPPSASLVAFLNEYLQSSDDDASPEESRPTDDQSKASAGIEVLRAALTAEQRDILPQNSNFFAMKNVGIVRKNGFSIRKLVILYCVNIPTKEPAAGSTELLMQKFCCYHYWYPDWPDHRSPRDINTLLDICVHVLNLGKCELEFETFACTSPAVPPAHVRAQQVQLYQQDIFNSVQPLPIIHCSAGIGRTGCFTAILNGIRQLRQSLAYSLTSMAAAVSKRNNAEQVLSPVDFCLPASFLAQPHALDDHLNNDTDNSFTRNTLLYLKYILQKQTTEQSLTDEQSAGDAGRRTPPTAWQIPSLNELPKMPDVFVDILGIVCNLRLQRGGMVQNSEQYELIHRAICLYMKRAFALKRF